MAERRIHGMAWWVLGIPLFLAACATPPDYPVEPHIEFLSVSKDTLKRGIFTDTTFVRISFTDGDGDIGHDDTLDLFLIDTRDGSLTNKFTIPEVPKLGANNGIKGEITIQVPSSCCLFDPDLLLDPCNDEHPSLPYDRIVYEIFLIDRAGHRSNVVQTTPIYIQCFD
ncbi:MAG: hypothetical protein KatS3mg029_0409 [Saprospiraceae bacterium]|nr:MAG: hypothetical protein KatS3mg029_0409 [Saprospiraceae bacterium]